VVWALASLPSTAALVAFPLVMDGAAGPGGRFELLGRRWAIAGVSAIVAVTLGGQFLAAVPFPENYEVLLLIVTLGGFGSFLQSSRLKIVDQVRQPRVEQPPRMQRLRSLWRLVISNRPFVGYELRTLTYIASIGLALPVLPLFYVHDLAASDAWIGIIGAASSGGSVLGYVGLRRVARSRGGTVILLPALLGAAWTVALTSVVNWLPAVALLAFAAGIAAAGAQLALFDRMMRTFPKEHGVTFSSVDQSVQNFALVVTPNIAGFLAIALGSRHTLLLTAAVGFVAVALFALEARSTRVARAAAMAPVPGGQGEVAPQA
jgi:predicted MFS family arabinose efflux permease